MLRGVLTSYFHVLERHYIYIVFWCFFKLFFSVRQSVSESLSEPLGEFKNRSLLVHPRLFMFNDCMRDCLSISTGISSGISCKHFFVGEGVE